MFPYKIILVTILVSALIAFLGDRIGHFIGRRRMSFLKLRPRNTATIFTTITGVAIALLTIFSLLLISSTARTAFFGIEKLRAELGSFSKQVTEKNLELKNTNERLETLKNSEESLLTKISDLKNERATLSQDVAKLKEIVSELLTSLKSVRAGEIFVRVGEILDTQIMTGGQSNQPIEKNLKNMLSKSDSILRIRAKVLGKEIPASQRILWLSQEELNKAGDFIRSHKGPLAVRLNAGHNATVGEQVVVHFEIFENVLVFKKNELILEVKIPTTLPQSELEKKIQAAFLTVRDTAEKKGLLPDQRGFVGTVPYEKIFSLVGEIKKLRAPEAVLKIRAGGNIFTSGPLELSFQVGNSKIN